MPYYAKSEDWLHQSALLLQARPETTRITTRYHVTPYTRREKKLKARQSAASQSADPTPPSKDNNTPPTTDGKQDKPPRGHLVLKTFDPHSGVALKYKTSKAAEVGRLVQMLGSLARGMAGVPDVPVVTTTPAAAGEEGNVTSAGAGAIGGDGDADVAAAGATGMSRSGSAVGTAGGSQQAGQQQQQQQQQGGGKGKKKKGKR